MNYSNKKDNMEESPPSIKAEDLLSRKAPRSEEVVAPKSKRERIREVLEGATAIVSSKKRLELEERRYEIERRREKELRDYEAGLILLESFELIIKNPNFVRRNLEGGGYSLIYRSPQKKHPEDEKEEPEVIEFRVGPEEGKESGYDVSLTRINTSAENTLNHMYMFKADDISWKIDTSGRPTPDTETPVSIASEDQIEFLSAYTEKRPMLGDYLHCRIDAPRSFAGWDARAIRNHFEGIKASVPPLNPPPTK